MSIEQLVINKINLAKSLLVNNIQEAKNIFIDCINIDTNCIPAYYYLTKIYIQEKQEIKAIALLEKAIEKHSNVVDYNLFLAEIYFNNLKEYTYQLISLYEKILKMGFIDDIILYRLSFLYHKTLKLDKSNEYLMKLYNFTKNKLPVNLLKQYTTISALAFNYNYIEKDNFYSEYKDFMSQFSELKLDIPNKYKSWDFSKKNKIRLGFVSGDFKAHPVNFFLKSLLQHINKNNYELVAFSTMKFEDEETKITKKLFDEWNNINLTQVELSAKVIYDNQIDILFDLSGHTANNGLPVFKYKPSPIQISWLGYFASTMIKEIDYFITSEFCVTDNENQYFTEKVLKLPETYLSYDFSLYNIECNKIIPYEKNGYITFGFFQNLSKHSDNDIKLWKNILNLNNTNKLLIKAKELSDETTRNQFKLKLISYGINIEQVIFRGITSLEEHLKQHNDVDIMLDSFNVSGCTTTCQSLYMGVPIITNKGVSMLTRHGEQFLKIISLESWIANSLEDYVNIAKNKVVDIEQLKDIKKSLRSKVLSSSIGDGKIFAEQFENLLLSLK